MIRFQMVALLCIIGCRGNYEIDRIRDKPDRPEDDTSVPERLERNVSAVTGGSQAGPETSLDSRQSLNFAGVFVPSGWMGDAENPSGPLQRRVRCDDYFSAPSCEEWTYKPTGLNSAAGFVAVAYQSPASNFGQFRGKNLSRHRFTHVTFRAKSATSRSARVIFKCGGHTRPGATHPASFDEVDLGLVELGDTWTRYTIPIDGLNHSSIACGLAFVLLSEDGPCTFLIDDIAFEKQ